jgi:type IX secretion system PorP/SprF family membrane protein
MKRGLTLALLLSGFTAFGQQLPQYSQYQRNQIMANPAAVGAFDHLDITLGGRYQWLGFGNSTQGTVAPRTAYLYGGTVLSHTKVRYNPALRISNGPIRTPKVGTGKLKHAVGAQVVMDEYGAFNNLSFGGMYAIHIPLSQDVNMSFGVNVGLSNHSFLPEKASVLTDMQSGGTSGTDPVYDNFIAGGSGVSRMFMDLGAGMYIYSQDFFFSLSSNQLTTDLVSLGTVTSNFNPKMHFQASGGYKFHLNDDWTLMPSAMVKYMSPAPISMEFTLQAEYKEWLWFAASYRHTDAIIPMLGANLSQKFKIGYSYDYSISRINTQSSGGHEVILGFYIR